MIDPADKEAFLASTSSNELQMVRIRTVLRAELDRSRAVRAEARDATVVRADVVDRVRRRLVAGRAPARPAPIRWGMAAAVLAAACAAFLLGRGTDPTEGTAIDVLASGDVSLELDGLGTVGGTPRAPEIRWTEGTLRVAVTPERGVHLAVVTPEATVRVIGTQFSVDRTAFATAVAVSHGTVEVTCAGEAPVRVPAPGSRRCLPTDAPTLLRRATALRRAGADPALRLEAIDAGLAAADIDVMKAELLALKAEQLAAIGQVPGAVDAIRSYLALGGPRRSEMLDLWVGLAEPDCAAEPVLAEVAAADPSSRWAVRLAACVADRDPARAAALLDAVADPGELAPLAAELRARLGMPR